VLTIYSYTIYHSPNAYLGSVLLRRALADLPDMQLIRRPFLIPRTRGVLVADLIGSKEPPVKGSYNREDCARWSQRYDIPFVYPPPEVFLERRARWSRSKWEREELPSRAFYAALGSGHEDELDQALFEAAWVAGFDVNEPETIQWAATRAGLDADRLFSMLESEDSGAQARKALAEFDTAGCPGVPTFVLDGERYFGKDRVDWLIEACRWRLLERSCGPQANPL
jgi:2-hydroxychromene-2-carboxylate isomerase